MTDPVKFLVADPLGGVQSFARQLLQGYGFAPDTILCCATPEAALAQGLQFKPDLLITDWFGKADMSGIALYHRLRDVSPGLRVGLLSFEISPEHEAQAQAVNALHLLRKPFTAEQLKATLGLALDGLAKDSPALHQRLTATMLRSHPEMKRAAPPSLPVLPALKVGDRVSFKGETHTIQYVVHRHGETAIQVKGRPDLIPESKLQRL